MGKRAEQRFIFEEGNMSLRSTAPSASLAGRICRSDCSCSTGNLKGQLLNDPNQSINGTYTPLPYCELAVLPRRVHTTQQYIDRRMFLQVADLTVPQLSYNDPFDASAACQDSHLY
jgi:hypothetical protein